MPRVSTEYCFVLGASTSEPAPVHSIKVHWISLTPDVTTAYERTFGFTLVGGEHVNTEFSEPNLVCLH